jgi:putative DNA methylase
MRFPETVTRRNLPHWYMPGAAHFVTYRLHGSLPQSALEELQNRKQALLQRKPPAGLTLARYREQVHKQLFAQYEQWLDRSKNDCLSDPCVAALIRSNLYHHSGTKYHLMAYSLMPNHVHVLFQPLDVATGGPPVERTTGGPPVERTIGGPPVERTIGGPPVETTTGGPPVATVALSPTGMQAESYDHWVRDDDELERVVDYIRANPVLAGLVQRPECWFWCSCHDRFLLDGATSGWLVAAGGPPED